MARKLVTAWCCDVWDRERGPVREARGVWSRHKTPRFMEQQADGTLREVPFTFRTELEAARCALLTLEQFSRDGSAMIEMYRQNEAQEAPVRTALAKRLEELKGGAE